MTTIDAVPAMEPTVPPPQSPTAEDREVACRSEIIAALAKQGCTIQTMLTGEPVGNHGGKLLIGSTWRVVAMLLGLMLSMAACAGGPDPLRFAAERASYELSVRCAIGWFGGLPWTPDNVMGSGDKQLVEKSLADWRRRLDGDAALLGVQPLPPVGGAK